MGTIVVLSPIADVRNDESPLATRVSDLAHKRIGFLNNRKANVGSLLESLESLLRKRYEEFVVIKAEKNAALAAPKEVMNRMSTCDAVIAAIGD